MQVENNYLGQRDWVFAGLQRKNIDDPIGGFDCPPAYQTPPDLPSKGEG